MDPIEKRAEEIIEETGLLFVPTKVIAIAHFYGFDVYDLDNIDDVNILAMAGISEKYHPSKKIILMNSKFSDDEKRYAIAHELGHYFLAGSPESDYAHIHTLEKYNEQERDALIFASTLLMPKDEVKRIMKRKPILYPSKISYITALFGVPEEVAIFRLKRLKLWEFFI